jgi:predicted PurR-regulated permease PerM
MTIDEKTRSPEEQHQRQTWLEIWLPLLAGIILCAAAAVLAVIAAVKGNSSISQWSAVSLILILFPSLIVCIVLIALTFFIDHWLIKGNRVIPNYAQNLRQHVDIIAGKIQNFLLSIVSTLLSIQSKLDIVIQFLSRFSSRKK